MIPVTPPRDSRAARDAELELQVMLTSGEAVKGKAKEGMIGNYFVRKVRLKVLDRWRRNTAGRHPAGGSVSAAHAQAACLESGEKREALASCLVGRIFGVAGG